MQNFKAIRWLILTLCVVIIAVELALGRSHAQLGLTVGAAAMLYLIVTEFERRL